LQSDGVVHHQQAAEQGMLTDTEMSAVTWNSVGHMTAPTGVQIVAFEEAAQLAAGNTVTDGDGLSANLYFRPDGSVYSSASGTGGTVYVADSARTKFYRVVLFKITGAVEVYQTW
jgi:hypothetical protein